MIYKLTNRYGWFVFPLSCFQRALHSSRGSLAIAGWPFGSKRSSLGEPLITCRVDPIVSNLNEFCFVLAARVQVWACLGIYCFVFFYHHRNILFPRNPNAADTPKWSKWRRRRFGHRRTCFERLPPPKRHNMPELEIPERLQGTMLSVAIIIGAAFLVLALVGRWRWALLSGRCGGSSFMI